MYQDILKDLVDRKNYIIDEIRVKTKEKMDIEVTIKCLNELVCPCCNGTGEERVYGPSGSLECDTCSACGGKGYKIDK